ncbi:uncharacterized protein LOC116350113 [Contarinia nasturtii]|uniref:uncharacterized protein LOC116350113 n=1 Tax=Contarinia nasturtii TaxID=265458 RepID=UPI0012D3FE94|nr:uncharacterized protein LOC116350113 [Contarinia nasturtii]
MKMMITNLMYKSGLYNQLTRPKIIIFSAVFYIRSTMSLGLLLIFLIGGNIATDPLHHRSDYYTHSHDLQIEDLNIYHVPPEDINIREDEHTPSEKLLWTNANVWVEAWIEHQLDHHTYSVKTEFINEIPAGNVIEGFRANTHRGWNFVTEHSVWMNINIRYPPNIRFNKVAIPIYGERIEDTLNLRKMEPVGHYPNRD